MAARQIYSDKISEIREISNAIEPSRKSRKAPVKQKLLGVVALLTVVAEFTMGYFDLIDQGGAFIIMLPLGLYLLFTKEKVIM